LPRKNNLNGYRREVKVLPGSWWLSAFASIYGIRDMDPAKGLDGGELGYQLHKGMKKALLPSLENVAVL